MTDTPLPSPAASVSPSDEGSGDSSLTIPDRRSATEGFIYFVRIGHEGPFKVGFATDVKKRVARLQVGCPNKLVVIHQEPGSYADEARLHRIMAEFRIRGEWFSANHVLFRHLKAAGVPMRPCDAWKMPKSRRAA